MNNVIDTRTIESNYGLIDKYTKVSEMTQEEKELLEISTQEIVQELSKVNLDKEIKERQKRIKKLQRLIKLEETTKKLEKQLSEYNNNLTF